MEIKELFKFSWASNASYIKWNDPDTSGAIILDSIDQRRMPEARISINSPSGNGLASNVFNPAKQAWKVLNYHPNNETGFSATLFGRGDEKILAVRGSETGDGQIVKDLLEADLQEIGYYGIAISQLVSLYNHVNLLQAEAGETGIPQLIYRTSQAMPDVSHYLQDPLLRTAGPKVYHWFEKHYDGVGLGGLDANDSVTLTGHSLGGHLAAAMLRLKPDYFNQAVSFNAPGFDAVSGIANNLLPAPGKAWSDEFIHLFELAGASPASGFGVLTGRIHTIESESSHPGDDWSLVASALTGAPPGPEQYLGTEKNSHSMDQMVDALALQSFIAELNPQLTLSDMSALLWGASAQAGVSEERLVEQLTQLLLNETLALPASEAPEVSSIWVSPAPFETRVPLHERILDLSSWLQGDDALRLTPLGMGEAASLLSTALSDTAEGLAARYALVNLNHFVIDGDELIYQPHNTLGGLELLSPQQGTGTLSEGYLAARAEMLDLNLLVNWMDLQSPVVSTLRTRTFIEFARSGEVSSQLMEQTPLDPIREPYQTQFGSDPDEALTGGSGNDRLFGGGGDDSLHGGGGDDYLEGGVGSDRYVLQPDEGLDTLLDSDGLGSVEFDDRVLAGGHLVGHSLYRSGDGAFNYLISSDQGMDTLLINRAVRIEQFDAGDLGLQFDGVLEAGTPPTKTVLGTAGDDFSNPTNENGAEEIRGGGDAEHLKGLAGADRLVAQGGDDWIEGGSGDDTLVGGDGNDQLYAADPEMRPLLMAAGDGEAGSGHEWLSGGNGEDLLYGSEGADVLNGGGHADMIWGGAGGDMIAGDSERLPQGTDWYARWIGEGIIFESGTLNPDNAANDTVIAGAGDDRVWGQAGDDIILGGYGDDSLSGDLIGTQALPLADHGDDLIDGGEGNDGLSGDGGNDILIGGGGDDWLYGDSAILSWELASQQHSLRLHGSDHLYGGSGEDTLVGGAGRDTLSGGSGDDRLYGDDHRGWMAAKYHADDDLAGGAGNDQLFGNGGNDRLQGNSGADEIWGGAGRDLIDGGEGDDYLVGDDEGIATELHGDDELIGGPGADTLYGLSGADTLHGGSGNDLIYAGPGRDRLLPGAGFDHLFGAEGRDHYVLYYGDGVDIIHEADDEDGVNLPRLDRIKSALTRDSAGNSYLELRYSDRDTLYVEGGLSTPLNRYTGMDGREFDLARLLHETLDSAVSYRMPAPGTAYGGRFGDTLVGSDGADSIYAQSGDDLLAGAVGDDWLAGGEGNDRYRVGIGTGHDRIEETVGGDNTLQLTAGLALADLSYRSEGESLHIEWRGGSDGVQLVDFHQRNQRWVIETSSGDAVTLSADSAAGVTELPAASTAGQLWDGYQARMSNAYTGLLRNLGYLPQSDGAYTRTLTSGRLKEHYRIRMAQGEGIAVDGSYLRTLPDLQQIRRVSRPLEVNESTHDGSNARFVSGSPLGGAYVELGTGVSGIRLGLNRIPHYGPDSYTNPLTGEVTREIVGYSIFPDGARLPGIETVTRTYSERQVDATLNSATILAGAGDDRVDLGGTHFNRVDGGAGNDHLDASASTGGIPLPGNEKMHGVAMPGLLLLGNDGDDRLFGSALDDQLSGGSGRDYLAGGEGGDSYYQFDHDGGDRIFEWGMADDTGLVQDRLILPAGVGFEQLDVTQGRLLEAEGQLEFSGNRYPIQSMHASVRIDWSGSEGVTLVLPHSGRQAGTGIDLLLQQSGETLAFDHFLSAQGGVPDVDPQNLDNEFGGSGILSGGPGMDRITADPTEPAYGETLNAEDRVNSILVGGSGQDQLIGQQGSTLMIGGALISDSSMDYLRFIGSYDDAGNLFRGGADNDEIWTTAGPDVVEFDLGDGRDSVNDLLHYRHSPYGRLRQNPASGAEYDAAQLNRVKDQLRFGMGIQAADISVLQQGEDLSFQHANGRDEVLYKGWFASDVNQLQRVDFTSGIVWGRTEIDRLLRGETLNHAPSVAVPPADHQGLEMSRVDFGLPEGAFNDPDTGDALSISAALADGAPLPQWLRFDSATRLFSGLPGLDASGDYAIGLTATDRYGSSVTTGFTLMIADANPPLSGGDAADTLTGGNHADRLNGAAGNDRLYAGGGDDTLLGGSGSDLLDGGAGNDLLYYSDDASWGGYIYAYHAGSPGHPGLGRWHRVNGYLESRDVFHGGEGEDRLLGTSADDALFLDNGLSPFPVAEEARLSGIEVIEMGDGDDVVDLTSFDYALGNVRISGGNGADLLWSSSGDDLLQGDAGDDQLAGGWGRDTLQGGAGSDRLEGGWGDDLYCFEAGDGSDRIAERAGEDRLRFGSGIDADQLWLQRSGQDLLVSRLESSDSVNFERWYSAADYRVEQFELDDGRVLPASQLQQLVDAMAQFDPPASGGMIAGTEMAERLQPLIANVWRPAA